MRWGQEEKEQYTVPTWVNFKNVPPEILDSVIRFYALLFRQSYTPGVTPSVIRMTWPEEKGEKLENGDRSIRINLAESIPMENILKEGQQECYKCKLPPRLCTGDRLARQCKSEQDEEW